MQKDPLQVRLQDLEHSDADVELVGDFQHPHQCLLGAVRLDLEQSIGLMELTVGRAYDADLFQVFRTRIAENLEIGGVKDEPNNPEQDDFSQAA